MGNITEAGEFERRRKAKQAGPPPGQSESPGTPLDLDGMSNRQLLDSLLQNATGNQIVIPSGEALYDETQLRHMYRPFTIAQWRERIISGEEFGSVDGLNTELFAARYRYIKEHASQGAQRAKLDELAQRTWVTAFESRNDALQTQARDLLINLFGIQEAAIIIENLRIKNKIRESQDPQE